MNKKVDKDLDKSEESNLTEKNFQEEKKILDTSEVIIKKNKKIKLNKKTDNSLEEKQKYEVEISILREEKLRLLAEMENLRKRANREKIDSIKYGSANLAKDILSPCDNLARALDNLPEEADRTQLINNFINGLKMIQKELTLILEKRNGLLIQKTSMFRKRGGDS